MGEYGYAGRILTVDLTSRSTEYIPTAAYAGKYVGGRGFATRIYWEEVSPEVKAFDPANRLMFFTGPLAGFVGLAGSRWEVSGKSPDSQPESFSYSNLGGNWGAFLRFAGYDGIVIGGRADRPVYLLLDAGAAEVKDASDLWGTSATALSESLRHRLGRSARIVACGPAGENLVSFASLLADGDASGSAGFGAVMGSKKLKAIAVSGDKRVAAAKPEKLKELTRHISELTKGAPAARRQHVPLPGTKPLVCYGCVGGCDRAVSQATDGTSGKSMCESAFFYEGWARAYYGEWNEVPFLANRLCDAYGVDTRSVMLTLAWLKKCYEAGILTDENTGIPISKLGSLEFMETFLRRLSYREGFGDILAQGVARAAGLLGRDAVKQIEDYVAYDPRIYITTGLFYAVEPRWSMHQFHELSRPLVQWASWAKDAKGSCVSRQVLRAIAKRFWGTELAVDFSTYGGKALCAKMIQDRTYAQESLILCDRRWPMTIVEHSEDHVGDPTIESQLLSAVTGREVDEKALYRIGERVFNIQRAILAREGHRGKQSDNAPEFCHTKPFASGTFYKLDPLLPGKGEEVAVIRGRVLDKEKFDRVKDEYYELRGWEVKSGLQTRTKLEDLGLRDVADGLERIGLVS